MGKTGFMLLGGAIAIVGLGILILICMLASWINDKMIMHKINKKNNLNRQLAEAKDLIRNLLRVTYGEGWNYSLDWKVKAEQFLQEC